MNETLPNFYLASSESYNLSEPRKCYTIKRISGQYRDDYLLIKIDPPIIGQLYGLGDQDIDKVIVATRHEGFSLFPITKWPVYVHVARLLIDNPESREKIYSKEIKEIGWAELYETEAAAIKKGYK